MLLYYDGTYAGFLTAVFEGYSLRRDDIEIAAEGRAVPSLLGELHVETDPEKCGRVRRGLESKISQDTADCVMRAWLSHKPNIDNDLYYFIRLSFRYKRDITGMVQDATVKRTVLAAKATGGEAHKFLGILRFHRMNGYFLADMEPEYEILSLIAPHFIERFNVQPFAIRDLHYKQMLIYREGQAALLPVEEFPASEELAISDPFEQLWCEYYRNMTIPERRNLRNMMHFIPKRYWKHMPERGAATKMEYAAAFDPDSRSET